MDITHFIEQYKNHPILFVGTGISLRYVKESYTWDNLLAKVSFDLTHNEEFYFDLKHKHTAYSKVNYLTLASELEVIFNEKLATAEERNGQFKEINDLFYENMRNNVSSSRFKIYITQLLKEITFREDKNGELELLKFSRKNIASVITTNYDDLIEKVFEFEKLVGNDILLSNPYGSVYKIHGCCSDASKIIITQEDYEAFDRKYELIRAQLLSLFIHNPIIFLGYSVTDENIRKILRTIFSYVEPNSEQASKIRNNFLLVEFDSGSNNKEVTDHEIVIDEFNTIRINKLKTDDYSAIYHAISELVLPITALDIRKVQNVVRDIYAGSEAGAVKVSITENLDELKNSEKILAIGSQKTIQYHFQTAPELMSNYFKIVAENNKQLLLLIDKLKINKGQYFPAFAFAKICPDIKFIEELKERQVIKIGEIQEALTERVKIKYDSFNAIKGSDVVESSKFSCLIWNYINGNISHEEVRDILINFDDKNSTDYRKLLVLYDYYINH